MTIQSNAEVASQCATQIASGAIEISSVTRGTKDSSSEYTGNTDASTYIDKEASYSSQIVEQITQFVSLVQSVASEFDDMLWETMVDKVEISHNHIVTFTLKNGSEVVV